MAKKTISQLEKTAESDVQVSDVLAIDRPGEDTYKIPLSMLFKIINAQPHNALETTAKTVDLAINELLAKFDNYQDKDWIEEQNFVSQDDTYITGEFQKITEAFNRALSGYANGFAIGLEDGLFYLTHDGEPIGTGLEIATGSGGGLSFDSGYKDEMGYLHLTKYNIATGKSEDIEGFTPFFVGDGSGGGGGVAGSRMVFAPRTPVSSIVAQSSGSAPFVFDFTSVDTTSGEPTGNGTMTIEVGNVMKASLVVAQGTSQTIDIFQYLSVGANSVKFTITDAYGNSASRTRNYTVQSFDLAWSLSDTETCDGTLGFNVTPTGSGSKTIHILVDGVETQTRDVNSSGLRISFTEQLSSGSHIISCYAQMVSGGMTMTSKTLTCAVAVVLPSATVPVVTANLPEDEVSQYTTLLIPFRAIDPKNNPAEVKFYINNTLFQTANYDQNEHVFSYRATTTGQLKIGIFCGSGKWEKTISVVTLASDVQKITDSLLFEVDPSAMTSITQAEGTTLRMSQKFDTKNGGLQLDDENVRCLKVMKGDRLYVNYELFGKDLKEKGAEFEIIYKVENANTMDAVAISCMNRDIGLEITANNFLLKSEQTTLSYPMCEDKKAEVQINIDAENEDRIIIMRELGDVSQKRTYPTSDSFKQPSPEYITIGSDDCDVYVYLIRAYDRPLTREEVRMNYFANGKDASEIVARHDRNQIYVDGVMDVNRVVELNPNAHVIVVHGARLSHSKTDEVVADVTHYYSVGGVRHQWTAHNAILKVQGTTSAYYGDAAYNYDIDFADGITIIDSGEHVDGYAMTDNSIPVTYLNFKANTASSEHTNNIILADEYNNYQPSLSPARAANSKVRDTVEGHMCVMFFHNTSDVDVQEGATTYPAGQTGFYSIGCLNNSKKNTAVFGEDDTEETICVEVMNNIEEPCRFLSDDWTNDTFEKNNPNEEKYFGFRYRSKVKYPNWEDAAAKWREFQSWVVSCDRKHPTGLPLAHTEEIGGQEYSVDTADYRIAKFTAYAASKMDLDSMIYHLVFTMNHGMVDNRAKNVFFTYHESTDLWDVSKGYDKDTALGITNTGDLGLRYGYLDTDTIGNNAVFNASDSVLWDMIRTCFPNEIRAMYINRESAGTWDDDTLADRFDREQSYICEALWEEDAYRKYVYTQTILGNNSFEDMCNGKKRLQRRQFLRFQREFISSYFRSTYATSNNCTATMRGYFPSTWTGVRPQGKMTITPYCDLFINVRAASTDFQVRGYAGQPVEINFGNINLSETEVYVFNCRVLQDLGDLSPLYVGYTDVAQCFKLRRLTVGSSVQGYDNTKFNRITIDNAKCLEYVDIRGCSAFEASIDLSNNIMVKELYTEGTNTAGITFAQFGRLRIAKLNAIRSITANGLNYVEQFTLEDYANLTAIRIDDCPALPTLSMVKEAMNIARARITAVDWDTTLQYYSSFTNIYNADGIDDEGHTVEHGVLSGAVHFDKIGQTKYNFLRRSFPNLTVTYDEMVEEHTVEFQNYDGTHLWTATTEHGSFVEDPVVAGYVDTPTREPDTDNVYEWNGGWDKSLYNITEDVVVKPTFSASTRYNTVRFIDIKNGEVLQSSDRVMAHGSYYYTGEDLTNGSAIWMGWDKDTDDVTEDMDVYSVYVYPTLPDEVKDLENYDYACSDFPLENAAYTFAQFYAIHQSGQLATYGITYNAEYDYDPKGPRRAGLGTETNIVFILGDIGHRRLKTGGMSHGDWVMKGQLNNTRQMYSANNNSMSWDGSDLRKFYKQYFKAMDPHIRALIKTSISRTSAGGQSTDIIESEDDLWALSYTDVGFGTQAPYGNEVDEDARNKVMPIFPAAAQRIRKTLNGTGTARDYWTRSPDASSTTSFWRVANAGNYASIYASGSIGVVLCFST